MLSLLFFFFFKQKTAYEIDTEYAYDSYGNLEKVHEYGNDDDPNDDRVIYPPYHQATTPWIFAPKYTQTKNGAETEVLSETRYFYDGASSTDTLPTYGKLTAAQKVINSEGGTTNTYYVYDSSYGRQVKKAMHTDFDPTDAGTG